MLTIPQLVNGKENLASIDGKCLLYPRFLADVRCALVHPFCITWLREQCLAWSIQTATPPSRIENAYQNNIILGHCDFPVVTRWYILMKYYCFFFFSAVTVLSFTWERKSKKTFLIRTNSFRDLETSLGDHTTSRWEMIIHGSIEMGSKCELHK